MRNYALSLIIHVAGIVMLAVGGAFAVTQNLWFGSCPIQRPQHATISR